MKHTELIERLRGVVQKLRRTPMPIADVAPMVSEAADAIESLQAEVERLNHKDKLITKWTENGELIERLYSAGLQQEHELDALKAERDALKLDAERYRWLRTWTVLWSDKPQGEFNSVCLDKSIDAAMKGAA